MVQLAEEFDLHATAGWFISREGLPLAEIVQN